MCPAARVLTLTTDPMRKPADKSKIPLWPREKEAARSKASVRVQGSVHIDQLSYTDEVGVFSEGNNGMPAHSISLGEECGRQFLHELVGPGPTGMLKTITRSLVNNERT